jgi:hypothetical protein
LFAFPATSPFRETTLLDQQVGEGVSPTLDVEVILANLSQQNKGFKYSTITDMIPVKTDLRKVVRMDLLRWIALLGNICGLGFFFYIIADKGWPSSAKDQMIFGGLTSVFIVNLVFIFLRDQSKTFFEVWRLKQEIQKAELEKKLEELKSK